MIGTVIHYLKATVLALLTLLRKVLCFWRKERKGYVNPGSASAGLRAAYAMGQGQDVAWDEWEEESVPQVVIGESRKPETVEDHIQAYRQSLQEARRAAQAPEEPEPEEVDLFSDMTVQIKRQKKVFVGSEEGNKSNSNRLQVQEDAANAYLPQTQELADWDAVGQDTGWQVEDDNLDDHLRQQRRHQRTRTN